jgi:hypothetical protein
MRNIILTFFLACLFLQCGILSSDKDQKEQSAKKIVKDHCSAFYFVRHGETAWGKEDILKGPQDLELNQVGIQQAIQAGKMLKSILVDTPNADKSPAKIISSTLQRAIQTADKISEITGFPIFA